MSQNSHIQHELDTTSIIENEIEMISPIEISDTSTTENNTNRSDNPKETQTQIYSDTLSYPTDTSTQDENTQLHTINSNETYSQKLNSAFVLEAQGDSVQTCQAPSVLDKPKYIETCNHIQKILSTPLPVFNIWEIPDILQNIKDSLFGQDLQFEVTETSTEGDGNEDIDMGVPTPIKEFIRILGEGFTSTLTNLTDHIHMHICNDQQTEPYHNICTKEKLKSVIPIFLKRKRLGISPKSTCDLKSFEDSTIEYLWIWEAPSVEIYPPKYRKSAREAREDRMMISKRFKALYDMKEALLSDNPNLENKIDEKLNMLARNELAIKEKRKRVPKRQKMSNEKRLNKENEKFPKDQQKRDNKVAKSEDEPASCVSKTTTNRKEKKKETAEPISPVIFEKKEKENKILKSQQNLMNKWLKPSPSQKTSQNVTNSMIENRYTPYLLQSTNISTQAQAQTHSNKIYFDEWTSACEVLEDDKIEEWHKIAHKLPKANPLLSNIVEEPANFNVISQKFDEIKNLQQQYLDEFCTTFASPQLRALKDILTFLLQNRVFRQEIPGIEGDGKYKENDVSVNEVLDHLYSPSYCNPSCDNLPYLRTVYMYDNDWTRPAKHLLISKQPKNITFTEPIVEESYVEYDLDSDDEWFELHDADDVEDQKEDDEEEDDLYDDDDNFIVHDENIGPPPDEKVIFECVYDWEWRFEESERPYQQLFPTPPTYYNDKPKNWVSILGCIQDDWGGDPFAKLDTDSSAIKVVLDKKTTIDLIKHSHGKATSKITLIEEFRSSHPNLIKADIERKFKQFLIYEKRDDLKKTAWYAKPEAITHFNLADELVIEEVLPESSPNCLEELNAPETNKVTNLESKGESSNKHTQTQSNKPKQIKRDRSSSIESIYIEVESGDTINAETISYHELSKQVKSAPKKKRHKPDEPHTDSATHKINDKTELLKLKANNSVKAYEPIKYSNLAPLLNDESIDDIKQYNRHYINDHLEMINLDHHLPYKKAKQTKYTENEDAHTEFSHTPSKQLNIALSTGYTHESPKDTHVLKITHGTSQNSPISNQNSISAESDTENNSNNQYTRSPKLVNFQQHTFVKKYDNIAINIYDSKDKEEAFERVAPTIQTLEGSTPTFPKPFDIDGIDYSGYTSENICNNSQNKLNIDNLEFSPNAAKPKDTLCNHTVTPSPQHLVQSSIDTPKIEDIVKYPEHQAISVDPITPELNSTKPTNRFAKITNYFSVLKN